MKSIISTYKNYSVTDFTWDEDFIHYCKNNDEADLAFWLKVLEAYPEQEKNMADAKDFILHVKTKDELPSQAQLQNIWQSIQPVLPVQAPTGKLRSLGWLRVAAVLLLMATGGMIAYTIFSRKETITTQYAETRQVELPDHSRITLNANSTIAYNKKWVGTEPREVWLTGEAYFEVNHLHTGNAPVKPGERFIVHANGVDVEVLGTSFNVHNRHDAARITLTSGSIELKFADKKLANILMKPGEMINYSKGLQNVEKKAVNPLLAKAWKEHRLVFDNTSLKEVIQLLKDNYGMEANVANPELWNKKISGTISSDNPDIVIKGLSALLDINIEKTDKTLLLNK
ncbi:MAG: FecR domain-containing protein [Bacteroidota bacterium]